MLARSLTASQTLEALLEPGSSYRPSLYARDGRETLELGDLYDDAQAERGDQRRAYRGCDDQEVERLRAAHGLRTPREKRLRSAANVCVMIVFAVIALVLLACSNVVRRPTGGDGGATGGGGDAGGGLSCTRSCVDEHVGSGAGEDACGCDPHHECPWVEFCTECRRDCISEGNTIEQCCADWDGPWGLPNETTAGAGGAGGAP